jgi:hypothetical protein
MEGLRALAGVADLPVRVGAAGARATTSPERFASDLDGLLGMAARGDRAAKVALLACALWLLGDGEMRVEDLRAIADKGGLQRVAFVLADDAPHKCPSPHGRLPDVGLLEGARPRTHVFLCAEEPALPTLLTMADYAAFFDELLRSIQETPVHHRRVHELGDGPHRRVPLPPNVVRREVARFIRHPSAFAIGRLLDNPVLRRCDVVAIAARRPTTPAIVRKLTSSLRWIALPDVRAAVVANPFTPLRVALLLALTCSLRPVIATGNLHPRLRDLARSVAP